MIRFGAAVWALLITTISFASEDITARYQELTRELPNRHPIFEKIRLKPYRILLVPGLATDTTEAFGRITGPLHLTAMEGFLASFYQQRKWMDEAGIDYEMAEINRLGSCDENGDAIVDAILRSPKKVIVVTQSKAGVDALHGFVRY